MATSAIIHCGRIDTSRYFLTDISDGLIYAGYYITKDEQGNKYYKNKNNERWVIYSGNTEATKITSSWFMWIHHTIDKIPNNNERKYIWQKEHLENKTGTNQSYRPTKIKKENKIKKYETWKY